MITVIYHLNPAGILVAKALCSSATLAVIVVASVTLTQLIEMRSSITLEGDIITVAGFLKFVPGGTLKVKIKPTLFPANVIKPSWAANEKQIIVSAPNTPGNGLANITFPTESTDKKFIRQAIGNGCRGNS